MSYKLVFWVPTNSPHQKDFFYELYQRGFDIEVRFFRKLSQDRLKLGWKEENNLKPYEKYTFSIDEALKFLKDFPDRIHIVGGLGYPFTRELVNIFIKNKIKWILWSERRGVSLFYKVKQNYRLYKLLYPIYENILIRKDAQMLNKYAVGFFANGYLAKKQYIKTGLNEKKVQYLFYSVNPLKRENISAQKLVGSKYKYHFIYVGSLSKLKGTDILLKAFSKLKNPEWGLVLVGMDTSNGYFRILAKKLGIEDKTFFIGSVPIEKVNVYLSAGDVFILPSLYDGWAVVLNEAASIGLPLISTYEVGGAYHLIKDGKNGFQIKANSVTELYNKMKFYVENPNLINEHGKFSKEIFKDFTPQKNVERLKKALDFWLK